MFNISDSLRVIITGVNDPPENAEILNPLDGTEIENDTALDFIAACSDPDLSYGDNLTYNWSSSLMGFLGQGKVLDDMYLTLGKHVITLVVYDSENESAKAIINLSIIKKQKPKSEDGVGIASQIVLFMVLGIIILIVIIIAFLFLRQKKKQKKPVRSEKKPVYSFKKPDSAGDDLDDLDDDEFLKLEE
jgi:hypothetical protein